MSDPVGSRSGRSLVGVVGGVGPLATAYFLARVVHLTDAANDQDHVDLVVHQRAGIPDRTAFLLGRSADDPGPLMAACARDLVTLGAETVVLPCNTAEPFLPQVEALAGVPCWGSSAPPWRRPAVGCPGCAGWACWPQTARSPPGRTTTSWNGQGWWRWCRPRPDQAMVMSVIYDQVKAGLPGDARMVAAVADRLVEAGAQCVVLACTELSVLHDDLLPLTRHVVVDSVDSLARATVVRAGGRLAR